VIKLDFNKSGGLIPVVTQDYETGEVLMLAYMNKAAWQKTLETKKATYFSRSRQQLWIKGETSGHHQIVKEVRVDCDNDTILLKVEQLGGAACHTGSKSRFYQIIENGAVTITAERIFNPKEVYKQ